MRIKSIVLFAIAISLVSFHGCKKTEDAKVPEGWEGSVFIINEGPFQTGSGSIYAYKPYLGLVISDVFEKANGRPPGNIVQSLTVDGDTAYIVVHRADRIEVVDYDSFVSLGAMDQLKLPRYIQVTGKEKAFVTCWDSTIKVVNLHSLDVEKSIQAGNGPDRMAMAEGKLFVINSGGFGTDSTLTVVDISSETAIKTITIGDRPSGIQVDGQGQIWVLASGNGWNGFPQPDDTRGRLVCIDPVSLTVTRSLVFPADDMHPEKLEIDRSEGILYYLYPGGIFSFNILDVNLPADPLVKSSKGFYGLGLDQKNKLIYAADPGDYVEKGWVYRYHALDGALADSFRVGIIPNGFWLDEYSPSD